MLLKFYNLYSRMRSSLLSVSVALMLTMTLTACSPGQALGTLLGGGPNVAANVPIGVGQTVDQRQGVTLERQAPTVSLRPNSRVDSIDQSTTVNTNIPYWAILIIAVLAAGGAVGWVDNFIRWIRRRHAKSQDR